MQDGGPHLVPARSTCCPGQHERDPPGKSPDPPRSSHDPPFPRPRREVRPGNHGISWLRSAFGSKDASHRDAVSTLRTGAFNAHPDGTTQAPEV
ncbi:hypothetical protein RC1_3576 [Rhodospirillum centenum SW]|uniref:Uncharacterized protein n=1 Tax=Rhodospirillum centenum (strain ATCC 51521 / SW) TaxID=414684 RepID=B6IXA5_RHOCS|nr:hypothetical protein RC1_3576 [Rhodospirillum centenum SW]